MPFIRINGFDAKVWIPDEERDPRAKKHPCPDCQFCQWCGDDRCELCLSGKKCEKKEKRRAGKVLCLMLFYTAFFAFPLLAARIVALQPLGKVDSRVIQSVEAGIKGLYQVEVSVLEKIDLPSAAYYRPRARYRAEKLLDHLNSLETGDYFRIVGITEKDISTTKGSYEDWGILGLGEMGGNACVISTFRLGRGKVSDKQFYERLVKVVNHELGHTLGLEHCGVRSCLMEDAKGTVRTVDGETGGFCPSCRKKLQELIKGVLR